MDYVIVDVEATCWEGCQVKEMELIEIGAVYLDGNSYQPLSDFEQFVKPSINPVLTDFCRELTHIKQGQIDSAPLFPEAFGKFMQWINDEKYRLCSWGTFDYEIFNYELNRCGMTWPLNFAGHLNLKELYAKAYSTKASIGLREAMRKLSMPFEGRLHRGIDDARNIARVAQTFLMLDE
jgi:inhibitor of KinA sporulation pathway (predicted exonuclease)